MRAFVIHCIHLNAMDILSVTSQKVYDSSV
jgi:hypothetical protein